MTAPTTMRAPAKLNLTLEVVGRRVDGFHDLRSVFVRLDRLCDLVTIAWLEDEAITVSCDLDAVPDDDANICSRAARAYLQATGATAGAAISVEKNIPVAAGLGGGSSDAAAVLLAMNERFGRLDKDTLLAVAAGVGKDVPFFVSGAGLARVSGLGEEIMPLPGRIDGRFLLANRGIAVATPVAFAALDRTLGFMEDVRREDVTARACAALNARNICALAAALYNDFETAIEREHPAIAELRHAMRAFGARGAAMSGSGSTVFGLFESEAQAAAAQRALCAYFGDCWTAVV